MRNDPHFGPPIMFGLGGIFVETLRQVSFRLAPLADEDIAALASSALPRGCLPVRAVEPPANRAELKPDARRRFRTFAPQVARGISEIEINPSWSTSTASLALDALDRLRSWELACGTSLRS